MIGSGYILHREHLKMFGGSKWEALDPDTQEAWDDAALVLHHAFPPPSEDEQDSDRLTD